MEALRARSGLVLLLLDEEEAETLAAVAGDAAGELNTALAAGQLGEAEGRILDFVAALHREIKDVLTRGRAAP